jgi:hypothetical protein
VLGSKFQDDYMGARPDYQKLMARTRRFLPWPPLSQAKIAANEANFAKLAAAADEELPVEASRRSRVAS